MHTGMSKTKAKLVRVNTPVNGVVLYRVLREDLPRNQYIMVCDEALEIHTKPWLCGEKLHELAKKVAIKFLKVLYYELPLKGVPLNKVCELTILAGGLYYMIDEAFKEVFGRSIQRCIVSARRYQLEDGTWKVNMNYENFEALPDKAIVIIGDTIATGTTITNSLVKLKEAALKKGFTVDKVAILTISGAVNGSQKLKTIEEEFRREWSNFELHIFNCCAIFGLEPNGTDMPYGHPDTITPIDVISIINKHLTPQLARRLCSIFDWGDRTKNPVKHLKELIELTEKLRSELNDHVSLKVLNMIKRNAIEELKMRTCSLSLKVILTYFQSRCSEDNTSVL